MEEDCGDLHGRPVVALLDDQVLGAMIGCDGPRRESEENVARSLMCVGRMPTAAAVQ